MKINYQVIPAPASDNKYYPDYAALINAATCEDEVNYIRAIKARNMGFAFNMVYVTRQTCGHFEIFQSPQNKYYPLVSVLAHVEDHAEKAKCSHCICCI